LISKIFGDNPVLRTVSPLDLPAHIGIDNWILNGVLNGMLMGEKKGLFSGK
jgi:hypothetical protein